MPGFTGLFDDPPQYGKIAQQGAGKKKGLINYGTNLINAVYKGGNADIINPATSFNRKSGEYYTFGKSGELTPFWNPGKGIFPKKGSEGSLLKGVVTAGGLDFAGSALLGDLFNKSIPRREIGKKAFKKGLLFTKGGQTQNFEGFQPTFFQKRAQDYVNFALPEVAQQYRVNRDAINYGLTNRGLSQSSVADQARSRVERLSGQERQRVSDSGLEQANDLAKNLEAARQENLKQLYQSADPAQGLQNAIASASQVSRPSAFAPLGDLFSGLAKQYYTNQLLNNYRVGGSGNRQQDDSTGNFAPIN